MRGWRPLKVEQTPQLRLNRRLVAASVGLDIHRFPFEKLYELWERTPPPWDTPYLGLGSTPDTKSFRSKNQTRRLKRRPRDWVAQIRRDHDGWQSGGVTADEKGTSPRTVASVECATSRETGITDEDFATTPPLTSPIPTNSLYVKGVSVMRAAPTRKREPKRYVVAPVTAAVPRCLADTGAGPSIITTELLAQLPADSVTRDPAAATEPLNGPDGKPLRLHGTADIRFDLDGTACRHTFIVCAGSPLMILGNDFLSPREATIVYTGDGEGEITLLKKTKRGQFPSKVGLYSLIRIC